MQADPGFNIGIAELIILLLVGIIGFGAWFVIA